VRERTQRDCSVKPGHNPGRERLFQFACMCLFCYNFFEFAELVDLSSDDAAFFVRGEGRPYIFVFRKLMYVLKLAPQVKISLLSFSILEMSL